MSVKSPKKSPVDIMNADYIKRLHNIECELKSKKYQIEIINRIVAELKQEKEQIILMIIDLFNNECNDENSDAHEETR